MRRKRHNPESGYALLMILSMAAIVAITLYTQLPRVVFEAQRDKEQLLIDRGEQYTRAVQLFVRRFNRYPATMEELENTNNIRTLRRRYADPMTGKTDWRIVHAGPGGVLVDSVTTAKKTDASPQQTFITEMTMVNNAPTGDDGVNVGLRLRPSDQPGAPGNASNAGGGDSGQNAGAANTNLSNAPLNGPVMVLPDGRIVPAQITGTPNGQAGTSVAPGVQGAPLPSGVAVQQSSTPPLPGQVGAPPSAATSLINQILTTPRPGGLNGLPGGQPVDAQGNPVPTAPGVVVGGSQPPIAPRVTGTIASAPQQQVIGGGIAGIASKREQDAIKTYKERTAYNEWEFVYEAAKDPARRGATGASGGQQPSPGRGNTPTQLSVAPGMGGPGR
jgi:hypothetical protein